MGSQKIGDVATGSFLALVAFLLIASSVPLPVHAVTSAGYFFTMTLTAPTSDPFRRQWAAQIADNLRQINIDARLLYVTFGAMAQASFACGSIPPNNCGKTYADGGFDAIFVGFGGGGILPDFGTQNIVTYRSLTNSDYSPEGANFMFYHNDTYNHLADEYIHEFNASNRAALAQQMVRIVAQDRPDMPLFYPVDTYLVANTLNLWGSNSPESSATVTRDFQHWSVSSGGSISVAEEYPFNSVNQWVTGPSNTFSDAFLYNPTQSPLEEIDGRTLASYHALLSSLIFSSDDLSWIVKFKPHSFQDGVPVTSDDYIFSMMGSMINDAGSVYAGTFQGLLGNYGTGSECQCSGVRFVYLNGTADYVWGGNYSHKSAPAGFVKTSQWTAINDSAFEFTLSNAYAFTDPVLTGFGAEPMHIFEQIPFAQWESSPFATLHDTPYVYTYNHPGQANHGGNGSGTAYGPLGDGPYYYHGYDAATATATLVKWEGYWNATGLESIGLFNATTLAIHQLTNLTEVVQDFNAGKVNFVDSDFALAYPTPSNFDPSVGHLTEKIPPWSGFQDFVLQNRHPIFGTGIATPYGKQDPAHAARYARYVREAISHAIPRQDIVSTYLLGQGAVGETEFCPCFSWAYPADVYPDVYDLGLSLRLLSEAGYYLYPQSPLIVQPPQGPFSCSVPPGSRVNVTVPSFTEGMPLTLSGTFAIPPSVGFNTTGFYATMEESTDNGSTWVPVALTTTTSGAYYSISYEPTIQGSAWYRVLFTGIPRGALGGPYGAPIYLSPQLTEAYVPPRAPSNGLPAENITDSQFSSITKLQIGNLTYTIWDTLAAAEADNGIAVYNGVCKVADSINSSIAVLNTTLTTELQSVNIMSKSELNQGIASLNTNVSNLQNLAVAALSTAVILGAIAIFVSSRRRPIA